MNNCRRLTRREARIARQIADVPANRYRADYYGRTTPRMTLPGKVMAWCNSPAATETEWDRLLRNASPFVLLAFLVVGSLYVTLAFLIKIM